MNNIADEELFYRWMDSLKEFTRGIDRNARMIRHC